MEAAVCLPCLMEEVGGNNDNQRKLIRELLKKATQVCLLHARMQMKHDSCRKICLHGKNVI